ncbi:MAG TPA: hypothetical protein VFG14_13030 [Chthoniobacteraceae bacterium]|jgi:hypothetical protein|nr:hypothetical protein [Chthoniobacteraceae bacterium]
METHAPPKPFSTHWPPEHGWSLFLAWMSGVIVSAMVDRLVWNVIAQCGPHAWNTGWGIRLLPVLAPVSLAIWQAWLLFRKHRLRFILWIALPAYHVFLFLRVLNIDYVILMAVVFMIQSALLLGGYGLGSSPLWQGSSCSVLGFRLSTW